MAEVSRILYAFDTLDALRQEVATNVRAGRIYIPHGSGGVERERCTVVLQHPGNDARFELQGECVWARDDGVGVQLDPISAADQAALDAFVLSDDDSESTSGVPPTVFERVRNLSSFDQQRLAREGTPQERVALERRYGKLVWETLLRNTRITPPEIAKIARNGTIPKPLVELIVANATWLKIPEVRRALLSNPRCTGEAVHRVLRSLPKADLKLVPTMSMYTMEVRNAARQLLSRGGGAKLG